MIDGVPKKLPPFVFRERNRHGNWVTYFRRGKGARIRLPNNRDHPEFAERYEAALAGEPIGYRRHKPPSQSLEWLIDQYRKSIAWSALAPATRRQRENIFHGVIARAGTEKFADIRRPDIVAGREVRAATPAQARNFLDAMRGLFRWALDAAYVEDDPTEGVHNPARRPGRGFAAWSMDDVERYRSRWRIGTRERVWMEFLLGTGLRRGDAVTAGRQHLVGEILVMKTEKTDTEVNIAIRPDLAAVLKAGPTGDLAFICGAGGGPLTKESFGNLFRKACNEAGVKKSAHGLRKLAATLAAEAGLSVAELEALFGWHGGTMASHYTKTADRKRLALQAAGKIMNANSPHLSGGAGKIAKK